jgi:hypothetical protein
MQKYLVLLIVLLLSSCTTVWHIQTDCKVQSEEFMKNITTALISESYKIIQSDVKLGYLRGEAQKTMGLNNNIQTAWSFQINQDKVIAFCTWTDDSNQLRYCNDDFDKDKGWYWNVRNSLEKLCGNKLIFIKKE